MSNQELTEARLVYILVCTRKLLELCNETGTFPNLNFHCNWALHSKLDRKEAVKIIRLFDDLESAVEDGDEAAETLARKALHRTIYVFTLRTDFEAFLKAHALPTDIVEPGQVWLNFLNVYSRVVQDVPLEITFTPIKHISKVVVNRPSSVAEERPDYPFTLEWKPVRFDGGPGIPHTIRFRQGS